MATVSDCAPTAILVGRRLPGDLDCRRPLVGGNGHVVVGEVQDADDSDAGRTIIVHGDTAFSTKNSLRVPIISSCSVPPCMWQPGR